MLNSHWKQFKSGSDIRAVATDDISDEKINLTNDAVTKTCLAFAEWLSRKMKLIYPSITIAIGNDPRNSAMRIKTAAINAFRSVGVQVCDCGLASTPAMFLATRVLACTAAIEITASHHPKNRNGFKFFIVSGGLSEDDIEDILEMAQNEKSPKLAEEEGSVRSINVMNYYSEKLRRLVKEGVNLQDDYDLPLKGFKIVVDAGNGAGGFFANDVLKELGADVTGSIFLEPDGNFPNHMPNPEDAVAMKSIIEATLNSGADLGIIFDTDVDRASVVNSNGKIISKNKLIALASSIVLEKNPGGIIVTDSCTSDNLKAFIEKLGGNQFRFKRGYHNVIEMGKKINENGADCPLAIEASGHAAFKENDFMDDGAYLAAKIIIKMVQLKKEGRTIDDLLKNLIDAREQATLRIGINFEDVLSAAKKVLGDFKNHAKSTKFFELEEDNIEGVRVNFNAHHHKGWCLLRQSIHDPNLVLYVESYVDGGIASILNLLKPFLSKYPFLASSEINNFGVKK